MYKSSKGRLCNLLCYAHLCTCISPSRRNYWTPLSTRENKNRQIQFSSCFLGNCARLGIFFFWDILRKSTLRVFGVPGEGEESMLSYLLIGLDVGVTYISAMKYLLKSWIAYAFRSEYFFSFLRIFRVPWGLPTGHFIFCTCLKYITLLSSPKEGNIIICISIFTELIVKE